MPVTFFGHGAHLAKPLVEKGRLNVAAPVAGDTLRLSSMTSFMTDRLQEHNDAVVQWNTTVMGSDNRAVVKPLKLVDKAISNIGRTLEEMKTLSMMAEKEELTDEERIDLQIEMSHQVAGPTLQGYLPHGP